MADKSIFMEIDYHKNCLEQLDSKKSEYFKDKSIPLKERFSYYKEYGGATNFDSVEQLYPYPLVKKMCEEIRGYDLDEIYVYYRVETYYRSTIRDFEFKTEEELASLSPSDLEQYTKTLALIDEAVSNDIGIVEE